MRNLRAEGEAVSKRVEILLGAALDVLPQLRTQSQTNKEDGSGTRPYDFVFIDASW